MNRFFWATNSVRRYKKAISAAGAYYPRRQQRHGVGRHVYKGRHEKASQLISRGAIAPLDIIWNVVLLIKKNEYMNMQTPFVIFYLLPI